MSLNNFYFILYLGVLLCGYWMLAGIFKRKNCLAKVLAIYLLVASLLFAGISDLKCLICVMCVILTAYFAPLAFSKRWLRISKGWIGTGITINLLILGVFKYYNFFYEQISSLFGGKVLTLRILLPLGISFYTFSAISYIVDVYREKYKFNKSLIEVALYISFFPKLTSGPIVRANDFFEQLPKLGNQMLYNLEYGIQIFVYGCFKKMVLADHIGVFVDEVFAAPTAYHSATVLWAVISYSMQIYFDFSGYSDMAIGISRMFGFDFDSNFNFPYLSKNLTEFWKRWHISLSSWLQEYLYYPLGGNRKGKSRAYRNLILTMLLGGLWHGAAWTFIIWGLLHGCALVVHKLFMEWKKKQFGDKLYTTSLWNILSVCMTYGYVVFCWIWFRASSFQNAIEVIRQVITFQKGIVQPYTWSLFGMLLLIAVTGVMWKKDKCRVHISAAIDQRYLFLDLSTVKGLILFLVLCGLILGMGYFGNTVFIYGAF